jgi:hypothetical protein
MKSNVLTINQYAKMFPNATGYVDYVRQCSEGALKRGFIRWDKDDEPSSWAGPFPGPAVAFMIRDHTKNEIRPLSSIAESHEDNKRYAKYSRYYYPLSVFTRLGWDDEYWVRPYVGPDGVKHPDQMCTYSEMTEKELARVMKEMTPVERVEAEIKQARFIGDGGESHPKHRPTKENPFSLKFFGNDDCSYTHVFHDEGKGPLKVALVRRLIEYPSWRLIREHCVFTN